MRSFNLILGTAIVLALGVLFGYPYLADAQQSGRSATINFARPTAYTDATSLPASVAVTYEILQGAKGATKPVVATITATTAQISTGLPPGETCWQIVAIANGVKSAPSNEACKTFPFPIPEAVTITVT